jgi:formate dehydrogenase assembly factor FdhD
VPRANATAEAALPPLDPDLPTRHVTSTRVITVRGDELEIRDDLVVGEEPLEIRAAGPRQEPVQVAVTMRTPGQEE